MISKSVFLQCTPERAFTLFTESAGQWWPTDRRHTGDAGSTISIEAGGRFYERASNGTEVDLGIVRRFERPHRLSLDWYPGTGPHEATHVEVRFEAIDGKTRVTIDHDVGAAASEVYARNAPAYARSWDSVLAALTGAS